IKNMGPLEIRERCKKFAEKYIDVQRNQFERLGVRGDWENFYATFHPQYEAKVYEVLESLVEGNYIYRAMKPVHWCLNCSTALAQAEIEYHDHISPSIYVKFRLDGKNEFLIIWTTTPWTLPGNTGIAIHPEKDYVRVRVGDEIWILAKDLLDQVMCQLSVNEYEVVQVMSGKELEGLQAVHPLFSRLSRVILADYVDMETGTGCVHTAPGHGEEDYYYGHVLNGLEILSPVDEKGIFTEKAGKYSGLHIEEANKIIIEDLKKNGALLKEEEIRHSYPHCWRCKKPVIFRATEQWFISVEKNDLRTRVLKEIEKVKWIPDWGQNRISAMISERPDWCISRQRFWGTPIPAFRCKECGEIILSVETIRHFTKIVRKKGSNAWFELPIEELVPEGLRCQKCGSEDFEKMNDTLDVWIDSGSSFEAVLTSRPDHSIPVDMYLEGSDQHRGWFNASIVLSVVKRGQAPYKSVLTHGFIKDEQGRKMSKSLGNVVDPVQICDKYGADILRLWLASCDYFDDVRISNKIILQQVEVYKKIRNTIRYLLSNLSDFSVEKAVDYENLLLVDKWALGRLQQVLCEITNSYEKYEFSRIHNLVVKYCSVELSSIYLDVIKDRLYVEAPDSTARRSAQTVIHEILLALVKVLAPILTYTTEEAYGHLSEEDRKYLTIQAETWPQYREELIDEKLMKDFEELLQIREIVLKELEEARQKGLIGHSLDAKVEITPHTKRNKELLNNYENILEDLFIVSQVSILEADDNQKSLGVSIKKAEGRKCQRCWKYHPQTGEDERYPDTCPRCSAVLSKITSRS
ncbi:MAG: isoleucine--tRNA ligase, partial [Thermotogae bacterium]